jgi:RNA polymerase sigma-70 factor (ECF subfamily)
VKDPNVNPGGIGDSTSLSLLDRVKNQEPAAWKRLVRLYTPLVYYWCRQAGLSATDAEDVGQEVFRAVARKIGNFHRDQAGDTFGGWLRTITCNKVRDHRRKHQHERPAAGGSEALRKLAQVPDKKFDEPGQSSSSGEVNATEAAILCRRALELVRTEFEVRSWQAFWRVVVDGQKPALVAQELKMSANAVYVAKSRILQRLREEFAGLVDPNCILKP